MFSNYKNNMHSKKLLSIISFIRRLINAEISNVNWSIKKCQILMEVEINYDRKFKA